jgi:hypothetical protein
MRREVVAARDLHQSDGGCARAPLMMRGRVRRLVPFAADRHYHEGTRAP